jgi:lipoate-protein ligase A
VDVRFDVVSGVLGQVRFSGDFFGARDAAELESALRGVSYTPDAVLAALAAAPSGDYVTGVTPEDLAALFFA